LETYEEGTQIRVRAQYFVLLRHAYGGFQRLWLRQSFTMGGAHKDKSSERKEAIVLLKHLKLQICAPAFLNLLACMFPFRPSFRVMGFR